METLGRLSGVFTILSTIFLVIIPFFILKRNHDIKLISDAGTLGGWGRIVNFGMSTTGLFLLLSARYLLNQNSATTILLSLSGSSLLLGGIIGKSVHRLLHNVFIYACFVLFYLGALVYSINLPTVFWAIILFGGIGTALIYRSGEILKAQLWGIFFADVWAVLVYVMMIP